MSATLQAAFATLAVEELVRLGVRQFYIAPGSRSTPLVAAIARYPRVRAEVFVDERVAAFAALGYGRAGGRAGAPLAALVTTSGSAVAHALPAIVEADADDVPMVVISADRPPELHRAGANQTITQDGIFGARVRYAARFEVPSAALPASWWLSTLDEAVGHALGADAGPVHLNFAFRKPLESDVLDRAALLDMALGAGAEAGQVEAEAGGVGGAALARWRQRDRPLRALMRAAPAQLDDAALAALRRCFGRDGVVVVGGVHDGGLDGEREAIAALVAALGWPAIYDIASGLGLDAAAPGAFVGAGALLAAPEVAAALRPEVVLELGGHLVDANIARWLAGCGAERVAIRPQHRRRDPDHQLALDVRATVASVVATLDGGLGHDTMTARPFADAVRTLAHATAHVFAAPGDRERFADEVDIARAVVAALPADAALVLASSMPIRDVDTWALPRSAPPRVFANRGASGIDGLVATAMGVAAAHAGPTTLLIGDLALQHDLGALFALAATSLPLTVVCVDNGGGGIFHFLPIAAHADVFERYVVAGHTRDLVAAAAGFGLPTERLDTPTALATALARVTSGPRVIVVSSDREANVEGHRARHAALAHASAAALAG